MKIHKNNLAFSLTELVVVISILAILSTIAFVSYTNNTSSTRDDRRKLDIETIKIALQEQKKQTGVYPLPGDAFNITYSGSIIAKQGFLNKSVKLSSLDSIPTDPSDQHYYSYSVTADQKQYQLAATLENDGEEISLLEGDYSSVTRNILPNILLATSRSIGDNVEIGSGTLEGDNNRRLFLFNQSGNNIIHSIESGGTPITQGEELIDLLNTSQEMDYWQQHDYQSCEEISDAGKSIGPGQYQIMLDDGTLDSIYCGMTHTCSANQHLEGLVCVFNTRTCSIDNGTGTQNWDSGTNSWTPTPCVPDTCNSGYAIAGASCLSICTAGGETPCIIQ